MSYREKRRESYQGMSSGQLRQKIFQMMTFIDGQFSGSYDSQDMYDTDMGHLATLVDMIDVYNMSNPDNRMEYPKTRDETFSPIDWTPYMMNESRTVRITKGQLRRIIKEEKKKLLEMMDDEMVEDRYGGDQNYKEYRETEDKLLRLMQNMTPKGRQGVALELIGIIERYAHRGTGGGY